MMSNTIFGFTIKHFLAYITFIFMGLMFPFISNSIWLSIGTTFLIFAVVALSQDIILGRAGLYAMGHAMFFGMGAYVFAILISTYSLPLFIAIPLSGLIPLIMAVILALPIIHLRGDYFLVVSLGLNIIFTQILNNDPFGLTGGPNGLFSLTINNLWGIDFSSPTTIYFIALILLVLVFIILHNLNYSRIGRAFYFINHDDLAAKSVGINPASLKLLAFTLGALLAGLAGSIYVLQYGSVSPEAFGIEQSILLFAVVIVGGQGSIVGVIIGTFVMFVLPEIFREFTEVRYLVFGLAMILVMILRPRGILPSKFGFYCKKLLNQHE